jgi:hypothetical protein|tara:strand:- start:28469 stop:28876 length:408 start_codon:yes stop_codon:yes gene_type:complete
MKLIFINELGPDFRGNHIYEFIFSDTEIDLWGEDWEAAPAAGKPLPPDLKYIKKVGKTFKGGMELELGKNSDYFSMEDIIDGILSLAWEKLDEESLESLEDRLVFHFGESINSVEDKLYSKDLVLEYNKDYEEVK